MWGHDGREEPWSRAVVQLLALIAVAVVFIAWTAVQP